MKLSPHFSLEEFTASQTAARWGIDNTPTESIRANLTKSAEMMEEVRRACGHPINISSGYRCAELNRKIGGSMTSQHMTGQAVDFTARGLTPRQIIDSIVASDIDYNQLILEYENSSSGGWVHISWSEFPRRETLEIDRDGTRIYDAS